MHKGKFLQSKYVQSSILALWLLFVLDFNIIKAMVSVPLKEKGKGASNEKSHQSVEFPVYLYIS